MENVNPSSPLLSVRGLTVTYKGVTASDTVRAVDSIDYDVYPGQIMGIVGESGCGKSTQAYALIGLLGGAASVNKGSVKFDGHELLSMSRPELEDIRGARIGMIFQDPMSSLNPAMTVGDQLIEPLMRHKGFTRSDAADAAVQMLTRVGIADASRCMRRYPHELSGGMLQRAMISMAVLCKPDLLIADEPTTALDVTAQAGILELLKELKEELGLAIIFITHNFGVVAEICTHVSVMYAGRIVEKGPAHDIFHSPAHQYTRAMLHAIPRIDSVKGARLEPVPGAPINPRHPPEGCSFHPRCPVCVDNCSKLRPEERVIDGSGHSVCCWNYNVKEVSENA